MTHALDYVLQFFGHRKATYVKIKGAGLTFEVDDIHSCLGTQFV